MDPLDDEKTPVRPSVGIQITELLHDALADHMSLPALPLGSKRVIRDWVRAAVHNALEPLRAEIGTLEQRLADLTAELEAARRSHDRTRELLKKTQHELNRRAAAMREEK